MKRSGAFGWMACVLMSAGSALAQDAGQAASDVAPAVEPSAQASEPVPPSDASVVSQAEGAARPAVDAMASIRQDGCLAGAARASSAQISTFLAQPASILSDFGMTSVELSARVRALVGSDTRALDKAVDVLASASVDQRAAIGSGLGRAAFACQEVNPDYAALIQSHVADLAFSDVKTAFLAATNDIQVAAIAAASGPGAASAPGLSGNGVAGPGTAGLSGDDVTPTVSGSFPVRSGGSISYLEGSRGGASISRSLASPDSMN